MAKRSKRIAKRARAFGRFVARGGKTTAVATATGAISHFVANYAASNIDMLREHYLVVPGGMLLAGHFLRRKSEPVGLALCGAAGALGAMAWDANRAQESTTGLVNADEPAQLPSMFSNVTPLPQGPVVSSARSRVHSL